MYENVFVKVSSSEERAPLIYPEKSRFEREFLRWRMHNSCASSEVFVMLKTTTNECL